ncbi:NAD-P-binding protein [Stereum hirsutum FP-91666 SS1]|uniref:NAD-P-binding protein n=1 Tax=Stereum hirsutum (strain FP-91666) TaxID=721885 RepID=UPI0004449776|nr:NAD-P-binding protein [Stereum hirsutum FP-91666 SS1]EIM83947.1 NAD-P-binding protein [Stereum hirsutum FP-91666 SS1]
MAPVTNARHIFREIPQDSHMLTPNLSGAPVPGKDLVHDTSETIDLDNVPLKGGILAKALVLSIDPYVRSRLREQHIKGYVPAFKLGQPIWNIGIVKVIRSEHPDYKAGDYLYIWDVPFADYTVFTEIPPRTTKLESNKGIPWSAWLGVLGMPGQTAYMAWKEYSRAKKGETVFVTAASGPIGSVVVQLAKLDGCKVIASAGSDAKCDDVRALGADVVFNYKTESTKEILQREGPLDVYWDNVGGESLDEALLAMREHGRILQCGTISNYNDPNAYGLKNYSMFFQKELQMFGFLVFTLYPKYIDRFLADMVPLVKEGKIKHREDVTKGLEHSCQALVDVLSGKNHGKKVILVAED